MRLGRQAPRQDTRTLQLVRYLDTAELPPPPDVLDLGARALDWPMFANDRLGDCTFAAAAHMIGLWTDRASGAPTELRTDDVVEAYSAVAGYDPATGVGDHGAVELDVLTYWRQQGIGGHPIRAFVAVPSIDLTLLRTAANLFGGLYVGVNLPAYAQGQSAWILEDARLQGRARPGSWGGHAVNVVGYDAQGLDVITWGRVQRMSWAFWLAYGDEAWAVLSPDWLDAQGESPAGLDMAALWDDLRIVGA